MLEQLVVRTPSHGCMIEITSLVQQIVSQSRVAEGLCVIFCAHTTAGITLNENADPSVQSDILSRLDEMAPWRGGYEHREGNSAAHIKASLLGASQTVLVVGRRLKLGIWQGVYLAEFDGPRTRTVWVKVVAG